MHHQKNQKRQLTPLYPLNLAAIKNFDEMAHAMSHTAFTGRTLGEGVDVACAMFSDKESFNVLTLSGAMTMAQMSLVVCDMVEKGYIHAIVSTGALMCHGFVEAAGMQHYKTPDVYDDTKLRDMRLNRVYDTLEPEDAQTPTCSYKICEALGKYLHENVSGRGIFKSCYEKKVPIFIPAFTDSEIGLDLALFNRLRKLHGKQQLSYDPLYDLEKYAELIFNAPRRGIFTIGGGVPRNWAQQVAPFWDLVFNRIVIKENPSTPADEEMKYKKPFHYALRICPEPVHWGGLSGCTYSESISWGKIVPRAEGGKFAEVLCDATVAWPIIMKAVIERLENKK